MILDQITIHELVVIIIALLILVVVLIVSILLFSLYKYRGFQNKKKWTKAIEHKITNAIVEGGSTLQPDLTFAPYLKARSFRNLFLSVLVSSNNRFAGSAQNEVVGLFHSFGLENDAWRKVKKKSPYLISGGIQELTTMKVNEVIPELLKLVSHPNKQVYQEAQYALVNFRGFDGLFFLDTLKTSLSDWQQLRILKSIHRVIDERNDRVVQWLSSENKSVVVFTLRLIAQFQLLSYYDDVLELIKNNSNSIRKQVVLTLQALENRDTNTKLIEVFEQESLEVQLEIMKVLKLSKDMSTKVFLKGLLFRDVDSGIKISAAEVLILLGEVDYLQEMLSKESENTDLSLIIKHALQERVW